MKNFRPLVAAFILFLSLFSSANAQALSLLPVNFDQLVVIAPRIIDGTLIDKRSEEDVDSGYLVTYYTFTVNEWIKGKGESQLVIKQVTPDREVGLGGPNRFGLPDYTLNQRYLLFLAGDSVKGLTAPLGVSQGIFPIVEKNGELTIPSLKTRHALFNKTSHVGLIKGLSSSEQALTQGQSDSYPAFKSLIHKALGTKAEGN